MDYKKNLNNTLKSITIIMGWYEDVDHLIDPGTQRPELVSSTCKYLIDRVFDELSPLADIDVVISPFPESGDHRYCFPRTTPKGIRSSGRGKTGPSISVEFRSACDCGRESASICKAQFRTVESPQVCAITDTPVDNNRLEGNRNRCPHMGKKVLPVNRLVVVA
jgi:hypothetical protein